MALFARIGRLFRGILSLFVTGLEEKNPEALMEFARQDFRDKMARYNVALAQMAGIAERIKMQVKTKTSNAVDLERRIMANYRSGNQELAGSLAREYQELKADLEHDKSELADTESAYQANLMQARIAQREFETKIHELDTKLSQVKLKEAQAEAAAALSGVAFKVGDVGDTTRTLQDVLDKRYEKAAGKARLAADMVDTGALREKEAQTKALESGALADFLAAQGITTAPSEEKSQSQPSQMKATQ
jgi:phage shock protein A